MQFENTTTVYNTIRMVLEVVILEQHVNAVLAYVN